VIYTAEYSLASDPDTWIPLDSFEGDGSLRTFQQPASDEVSFRLRTDPVPPSMPRIVAHVGAVGKGSAELRFTVDEFGGQPPEVFIYYGLSDGGTDPLRWESVLLLGAQGGPSFEVLDGLLPGRTYYANFLATNGAGSAWAALGSLTFDTLPASFPDLISVFPDFISTNRVDLAGVVESPNTPPTITVFYGLLDGGTDPDAWDRALPAEVVPSGPGSYDFRVALTGLDPGCSYRFRMRAANDAGTVWSAEAGKIDTKSNEDALRDWLEICELMYHPGDPSELERRAGFREDDFEFIELYNRGPAPLDLSEVAFTNGIRFSFADAGVTEIGPGEYLLVVRNIHAFEDRYGTGLPVAGSWLQPFGDSQLSNGGETVTLSYAGTTPIASVIYDDSWDLATDGDGFSLILVDPAGVQESNRGSEWRASGRIDGSPGEADRMTYDLWSIKFFEKVMPPDADSDRDGRTDFEEYAFDSDPLRPDLAEAVKWRTVSVGGFDFLALAFPCQIRATDLHYDVQASGDLLTWDREWGLSLTARGEIPLNRVQIVDRGSNSGQVIYLVRGQSPVEISQSQFLRIVVSHAP
jgi:hypothetical protein